MGNFGDKIGFSHVGTKHSSLGAFSKKKLGFFLSRVEFEISVVRD